MAYITSTDLTYRVGSTRLANLVNDAVNQATILADVITRSEARVDAYLGERHETPVPASGFVQELTLCIAEYELYRRGSGDDIPDRIRKAYDDAVVDLKAIAAGDLGIGGSTAPTDLEPDTGGIAIDGNEARFDEDAMEDTGW
jgi:phage gp36-like protein